MIETEGIGPHLPVVFDNAFKEHKPDGTHRAPTALVQYVPIVIKASVAFDDASPKALITVQNGDIVRRVWVQVTTAFNGATPGTVTLGDGSDADGYANNANIIPSAVGVKLELHSTLGVYLWSGAAPNTKMYLVGDTIDATIVQNDSTQGAMDVYFEILRMKP